MEAQAQAKGTETILGGWSTYECIKGNNSAEADKAKEVFESTVGKLLGVDYDVFAYATQSVNGTNYRFLANTKGVYPNAPNELTISQVYVNTVGDKSITFINKIEGQAQAPINGIETILGGWSTYQCINGNSSTDADKAKEIFEDTVGKLLGVKYEVFAYATQTTEGINYRFLANSKVVYPGAPNELAFIQVHVDPKGNKSIRFIKIIDPKITEIEDQELDQVRGDMPMPGGWSVYQCINGSNSSEADEARKIFENTVGDLKGVEYAVFAYAVQVVEGRNFRFLCNSKVVYPGAPNELALAQVYVPLKGEPTITFIKTIED